jgi:transcriptional regulator GlxA family with amidase domain
MTTKLFKIEILIEPGFIATELALVCDVLRIANNLCDTQIFKWTTVSTSGEPLVKGRGGVCANAENVKYITNMSDALIVIGGAGVEMRFSSIMARIARFKLKGLLCILLSDASAEWLKRQNRNVKAVTHWENCAIINELRPDLIPSTILFENQKTITTSAGMISTADVLLDFVSKYHSIALANSISRMLVMECIRPNKTPQKKSNSDNMAYSNVILRGVLRLMEANIEVALTMSEISEKTGVSTRHVERVFKKYTKTSPLAYYRRLRVSHARILLQRTNLSLVEVGISCGYSEFSTFNKSYQREFGLTPKQFRERSALLQHDAIT